MYGDGILKSTDGGHWSHVSGDYFVGVSISRVVVDPTNANHLYVAVLRGRGGSPARHTAGALPLRHLGVEGRRRHAGRCSVRSREANGATDLEIDPQNPSILYASFWGDAMYKSTDAGHTWAKIMNGFPADADFAGAATRFSIAISHPSATTRPCSTPASTGTTAGSHHIAEVFKSTDAGASWSAARHGHRRHDSVEDYCGTQCFYDNVIEVDPNNPNVVYAGGSFGYDLSPQSGGIFRSTDGGQTWLNLGWDLHPDFHALAMDPNNPDHVLIGNDGGVWYSPDRGGRPNATRPAERPSTGRT